MNKPLLHLLALCLTGLLALPAAAGSAAANRYYEDGLARFERKDIAGAIIQLKNALQQDRNLLAAQLLLGRAYLADGDLGPAEVAFGEALRLGVHRAEVATELATIYLMQGRAQKLINDIPADGLPLQTRLQVLVMRGKAHAALGDPARALRSLEEAADLEPAAAAPHNARVTVLLGEGRIDEARDAAARAVELGPGLAESYSARASVAHAGGALEAALADYRRALELDPAFDDARVALAGLYLDLQRDGDARAVLDGADGRLAGDPRAAYLRALLAGRAGDTERAAAQLAEAARLVDALPAEWLGGREQLLMVGALAHHAGRQYEKARSYLEVLGRRFPRNLGARKLLAAVWLDSGEPGRAEALIDDVLRSQPGDAQAWQLRGQANLALRRYARATEAFERAAALGAEGRVEGALGFSLLGEGRHGAARDSLAAAFARNPGDLGVAIALATLHAREGDQAAALAVAERALQAQPDNPAVLNLAGLMRAAAQRPGEARAAYEKALRITPEFTPAALNLSRVEAAEGRFDAARARLQGMLARDRRDAAAMYHLALVERQAGNLQGALEWVDRAVLERPAELQYGVLQVELRAAAGNAQGAREAARELALRHPRRLDVLALQAQAEINAGDTRAALQVLREMTTLAEFDAGALVRIGYLQLTAGDPAAAAYSAHKALQERPQDGGALALATRAALAGGDAAAASTHVVALRRHHGDSVEALVLAGDVALARADHGAAESAFREAFRRQPGAALVLRRAGVAVARQNPAAARTLLEDWLRANPTDQPVRRALADLHVLVRNWSGAREHYEQLLREGSEEAGVYNNLAHVLTELGDPAAIAHAERAVERAPGNPNMLDTLGWALARQGRHEEALRHLREARLRLPSAEVKWHLGYVLAQLGREREARRELEAALAEGAAFEGAEAARSLLQRLSQ